ncbi:MAG: hypothetical protein AAB877_00330, partial [Patescibacteria group bacterium]
QMSKFLTKAKTYITLLPPLGDIPINSPKNILVDNFAWENEENEVEIKFIFSKPLKVTDKISEKDLPGAFYYETEITITADSIEEAAERSVFILEQVLDTASLFSQATCKIIGFQSIVNLTQIECTLKKELDYFEKGTFRIQTLKETKAFPPGRLIFLSEKGIGGIGRNIFWFRKGLNEFSVLYRFVAFFTALKELDLYFKDANRVDNKYKSSVKDFIEKELNMSGEFKIWGDIRNDIVHFSGRKKDFRKINQQVRKSLVNLYNATYFGIMKFFTDSPPPPSALILYDEIIKETVNITPEILSKLKEIHKKRERTNEIKLAQTETY